ncbi:hypothetical protein chiPu_0016743 [Chiloscyllium punctatum]|uniref:Uncharacterized protein n=1 Tax=Chiloscyllium punctatum TaxID=137246 RepID=A0A401T6E3_CHIPU|nr:hypothetical protein [Chiloscyllium punctatum]
MACKLDHVYNQLAIFEQFIRVCVRVGSSGLRISDVVCRSRNDVSNPDRSGCIGHGNKPLIESGKASENRQFRKKMAFWRKNRLICSNAGTRF